MQTPMTAPVPRQTVLADASATCHAQRSPTTLLPGTGSLQELARLMGLPDAAESAVPGPRAPVLRVQPDAVLLHEGSRGRTLYVVRSGSFKCVRTQEDGYEQVLTFAQPGELLGCEALHGGCGLASVVAMEDSTVYAIAVGELQNPQQRCPWLEEAMRQGLSRQLARAAETADMMAAVASDARLARFILWLSARMAEAGQSPRRLRLRMARREIASMLGVAHETVSRSFTTLAEGGYLRVDNREVEILDVDGLRTRARCTRGLLGDLGQRPLPPQARRAPVPPGWWSGAAAALAA